MLAYKKPNNVEEVIVIDGKKFPHPHRVNTWRIADMKIWPPVEFPTIFKYLIQSKSYDQEELLNYKSFESYNYFASRKVGDVLYHKLDDEICFVKAHIQPSRSMSTGDHNAWICVSTNGQTIFQAGCSCMAGQGKSCSHAVAILFKLEFAERKGLSGVVCTDAVQKWNAGTKRNLKPAKFQDINVKRYRTGNGPCEEESQATSSISFNRFDSHEELLLYINNSELKSVFMVPGTILYNIINATPITNDIPEESLDEHSKVCHTT